MISLRYLIPKLKYRLGRKPEPEVFVISYPKTGRTWLRALIGKAICEIYGLPQRKVLNNESLTYLAGLRMTRFYHDGGGMPHSLHYEQLIADKSTYASKGVILLSRDVKDTLVSCYFQATRRIRVFDGPLSEFVRSDLYGARKVLTFYRQWYEARHVPKDFLFITYEQMKRDAAAVLEKTLSFIGAEKADPALLRGAMEFASFDNLRKLEARNALKSRKLQVAVPGDADSFKVRKGIIGNYTQYLSPEDIAYIDRLADEMGSPFTTPAPPM